MRELSLSQQGNSVREVLALEMVLVGDEVPPHPQPGLMKSIGDFSVLALFVLIVFVAL